jgi:hypothetical protein
VTTPTTTYADPDEIELHARDVDRMCDWLAELTPATGASQLPGPHRSLLAESEQPEADLPGWRDLRTALTAHEAVTVRSQRLLLDRLQELAGEARQVAVRLRGVDEAVDRTWERLS